MMLDRLTRPGLARAAAALALGAAAAVLMSRYDAAGAGPVAPPPGAVCDAPTTGARAAGSAIVAQIRYDSGLVLRYCSVAQMAAQLRALEQPGLVRAVYVLGAAGAWRRMPPAA